MGSRRGLENPRFAPGAWSGVLLLCLSCLFSCRQALLDPGECETLALELHGVRELYLLRDPRVKAAVEESTFRCLTQPYDRRFADCLHQGQDLRLCALELKSRQQAAHR